MNERMVIVDGVRTPFCKSGTELAAFSADDLGRIAVNGLLTRTGLDPAKVLDCAQDVAMMLGISMESYAGRGSTRAAVLAWGRGALGSTKEALV